MPDILSARAPDPAPMSPLTAHLRTHLVAQFRADLSRDMNELASLPAHRSFRQQARHTHLRVRIAAARADLAALADELLQEARR